MFHILVCPPLNVSSSHLLITSSLTITHTTLLLLCPLYFRFETPGDNTKTTRGMIAGPTSSSSQPPSMTLRGYSLDQQEVAHDPRVGHRRRDQVIDDLGGTLDVMVVWTKQAECKKSFLAQDCTTFTSTTENNMRGLIDLAIAETNTAYTASGINTQLRLVHAYREPNYVEASTDKFSSALNAITSTTDGVMDDVHSKRIDYGADIVAFIINDSAACGLAWMGPSSNLMFSVAHWECATGYYSFGHEIGHNMVSWNQEIMTTPTPLLCRVSWGSWCIRCPPSAQSNKNILLGLVSCHILTDCSCTAADGRFILYFLFSTPRG